MPELELELFKVRSNLLHKLGPEIFDFLNFVDFQYVNDISETFHMAVTKL
jgi:hypothetical protein